MGVLSTPPGTTKYSFRKGDYHVGVWALQRFFNSIGYPRTSEDGSFGPQTEALVKRYQADTDAAVDGVVGPQTQARIVRSCVARAPYGNLLPKGLVEGQIQAESGRNLAAVNWNVPGGVDCGLTQYRVYGPPWEEAKVGAAFDPRGNVSAAVKDLYDRYTDFSKRLGQGEYAWRVAALGHNWPWGAEQLSYRRSISDTKACTWCNYPHTKFDDGVPVYSWRDWAEYYSIGSKAHNHPGIVTRLAYGVPQRYNTRASSPYKGVPMSAGFEPVPKPDDYVSDYPETSQAIEKTLPGVFKEAKKGTRTTEFWLTIVISGLTLVNGIPLPEKFEGVVIAALAAAYAVSRGLAKNGVPHVEVPKTEA